MLIHVNFLYIFRYTLLIKVLNENSTLNTLIYENYLTYKDKLN